MPVMLIHIKSIKYSFWVQNMEMPEVKIIEPTLKISYDLEPQGNKEWLLHLDAGLMFGPKGGYASRSTFKALGEEEEIFNASVLMPAVKKSFDYSRRKLREVCKIYGADLPPIVRAEKKDWEMITGFLLNQYSESDHVSDERPPMNDPFFRIKSDESGIFLVTLTLYILRHLTLWRSPLHDDANRNFILQYVPEPLFIRLYLKGMEIKKHDVNFTLKELIMLYYCIDCAAQCLAGKNYEKIKKAVYDFDQRMRFRDAAFERQIFLQLAQNFIAMMKKKLDEINIRVSDFNEPVFWDENINASF